MNIAFIPVRGGSKSIPLKNIKLINGKPLVYWVIKAACNACSIDKVVVFTDSELIKKVVEQIKKNDATSTDFFKVDIVDRSAESATDTASTEFAMLEYASKNDFTNIALIQATSPLLDSKTIDKGFEMLNSDETDSVMSAVLQKRFNWSIDENGYAHPDNYDVFKRPRRQEFDGYYVENGALYITSRQALLEFKNRVSGNIKLLPMSEDTYFEIDEESDFLIVESLLRRKVEKSSVDIPDIKLFLTDCDGCLTDGGMYYTENGDEAKKFNTRDGVGFSLLKNMGILTGIVTGENVELNKRRAEKLHLDFYVSGCNDKLSAIKEICESNNILLKKVAYVGDDLNDLDVINSVGFGCAPCDADQRIKNVAAFVTESKGGQGVIREIAELLLRK